MNTSFDTLAPNQGALTIQIDPQDYQPVWEKNLIDCKRKVHIKGFRKGQAPMTVVKQMYGAQVLEDSILKVSRQVLFDYIDEYGLETLGSPILTTHNLHAISPDHLVPCTMTYTIGFVPPFELPDLSTFRATQYQLDAMQEDMFNQSIEAIRESHATLKPADTTEVSHIVQGHFDVQGTPLRAPYKIMLNEDTEALHSLFLGKQVGDTVPLKPADIHQLHTLESLPDVVIQALTTTPEGPYVFHIQAINHMQLPPMDQAFYTKVLGTTVETEEAFREKLAESIRENDQQRIQKHLHMSLKSMLMDAIDLPLPSNLMQTWLQEKKDESLAPEVLQAQYKFLEHIIRWDIIIDKVLETYQRTVSDQDVEDALFKILDSHTPAPPVRKLSQEALRQHAQVLLQEPDNDIDGRLRRQLRQARAFEILTAHIPIQEEPITREAFYVMTKSAYTKRPHANASS